MDKTVAVLYNSETGAITTVFKADNVSQLQYLEIPPGNSVFYLTREFYDSLDGPALDQYAAAIRMVANDG